MTGNENESVTQVVIEIVPEETAEERRLRQQVASEVGRFYGRHIDELEAFSEQLGAYWEEEQEHFRRQSFYRKMEGHIYDIEKIPLGGSVHELGSTALAAAFKKLSDSKHNFTEQRAEIHQSGEILSRAFSTHMQARLPETTAAILGDTLYEWDEEVITTRFKEDEHGKTIIQAFCGLELSKQYFEKYLIVNSVRDGMVTPRLVAPRDWSLLMDNLHAASPHLAEPQTD